MSICNRGTFGEAQSYSEETDATVNLKVKAALGAGIMPIMCVGENLEERETGRAESVVESQVRAGLEERGF